MKSKLKIKKKTNFYRLPVVSHGAEYLVQGYLMRRNILAYKAPPNNEGYDLIAIHPNPRKKGRQIRIQVKSRYATDCNRSFPLKRKSFKAFDYLVVVFLNIGNFFAKSGSKEKGMDVPEFYTLPVNYARRHHLRKDEWEIFNTRNLNLERFKDERGFELIAKDLKIDYPRKR